MLRYRKNNVDKHNDNLIRIDYVLYRDGMKYTKEATGTIIKAYMTSILFKVSNSDIIIPISYPRIKDIGIAMKNKYHFENKAI